MTQPLLTLAAVCAALTGLILTLWAFYAYKSAPRHTPERLVGILCLSIGALWAWALAVHEVVVR